MNGPLQGYRLTPAHAGHVVWREISPQFTRAEFRDPDSMAVEALRLLHRIRVRAGVPFRLVSDARTPATNPGASKSAHLERPCTAIDLRVVNSAERFAIVRAAIQEGVIRIGVYPPTEYQRATWGKNAGSIHLDASTALPQNVMWVEA